MKQKIYSMKVIIRQVEIVDGSRVYREVVGMGEHEVRLTEKYQTGGRPPRIGDKINNCIVDDKFSDDNHIVLCVKT